MVEHLAVVIKKAQHSYGKEKEKSRQEERFFKKEESWQKETPLTHRSKNTRTGRVFFAAGFCRWQFYVNTLYCFYYGKKSIGSKEIITLTQDGKASCHKAYSFGTTSRVLAGRDVIYQAKNTLPRAFFVTNWQFLLPDIYREVHRQWCQ